MKNIKHTLSPTGQATVYTVYYLVETVVRTYTACSLFGHRTRTAGGGPIRRRMAVPVLVEMLLCALEKEVAVVAVI